MLLAGIRTLSRDQQPSAILNNLCDSVAIHDDDSCLADSFNSDIVVAQADFTRSRGFRNLNSDCLQIKGIQLSHVGCLSND